MEAENNYVVDPILDFFSRTSDKIANYFEWTDKDDEAWTEWYWEEFTGTPFSYE